MNALPWAWMFWGLVLFIAVRTLLTLSFSMRDRLRQLLVDHYENAKEELQKKENIAKLQAKVRQIRSLRDEVSSDANIANASAKSTSASEQPTRRAA
ncbi:hypothetical protein SH467x_000501 [Pirellulaceae bacterium SH467]